MPLDLMDGRVPPSHKALLLQLMAHPTLAPLLLLHRLAKALELLLLQLLPVEIIHRW
jgi:hypothetical protein